MTGYFTVKLPKLYYIYMFLIINLLFYFEFFMFLEISFNTFVSLFK